MKKTLLLTLATCSLLSLAPAAHAAPKDTPNKAAQIVALCQDKETRVMMLHELTSTRERKMEVCRTLRADTEFRSLYEASNVNPG